MEEQPIQTFKEDELSLLDILITLAESWRLLVFGPLLAGVLAGALSFLWTSTYESVSVVKMTEAEIAMLNAAPVLDPLIERFGLLSEFDGNYEDARQYLAKKIAGKLDKRTGLATITTTDSSPEKAQELNKATIDALLKELLPKGRNKEMLEEQISLNNRIIASSADVLERLESQIRKLGPNEVSLDVVMKHFFAINVEMQNKTIQNAELKKSLAVRGDEFYVQRPSLSKRRLSPKRGVVVLLAILLSGFMLLLFVFVRKAISSAAQDPETSSKLDALRTALGVANGRQ